MLKKVLLAVLVLLNCIALHKCMKDEEARQLALIRSITAPDARVVWSAGMSDGESRYFTYWNKDHCVATIGIRGDKSYYVREAHCSEHKLTKD